jgi:formiminoglutamase
VGVTDAGDVVNPDGDEGEMRVAAAVAAIRTDLLFGIGGDNSLTYSIGVGRWGQDITRAGLITFDAHHDVRDGVSNGSPVRRLIESGLAGNRVVQVGIGDFSNSPFYAERVREYGITVIPRSELRQRTIADVMDQALAIAGAAGGPIHVDLDLDVCDRSVVPGCPAAAPGGISADELRQAARWAAASPLVGSMDIAEIDATRDSADERTVRLGALCLLEAAAGLATRPVLAGQ